MLNNLWVLIVEDDVYARSMMELLLRRDWRINVSDEVETPSQLVSLFLDKDGKSKKKKNKIDLVLIDTDIPDDHHWIREALDTLRKYQPAAKVLFTGIKPQREILKELMSDPKFAGYLLKDEIRYSLSWAVSLTCDYSMVITPGIRSLMTSLGIQPLPDSVVVDGTHPLAKLTHHELDIARLAILFSMERRVLADDLGIADDSSFTLISSVYKKLGLQDILSQPNNLEEYFGPNNAIAKHFRKILGHFSNSSKGMDKEALVFHLITMPEIIELP